MKSLLQYIEEKLKINKDYKDYNKDPYLLMIVFVDTSYSLMNTSGYFNTAYFNIIKECEVDDDGFFGGNVMFRSHNMNHDFAQDPPIYTGKEFFKITHKNDNFMFGESVEKRYSKITIHALFLYIDKINEFEKLVSDLDNNDAIDVNEICNIFKIKDSNFKSELKGTRYSIKTVKKVKAATLQELKNIR